jgi:hypothetical protein
LPSTCYEQLKPNCRARDVLLSSEATVSVLLIYVPASTRFVLILYSTVLLYIPPASTLKFSAFIDIALLVFAMEKCCFLRGWISFTNIVTYRLKTRMWNRHPLLGNGPVRDWPRGISIVSSRYLPTTSNDRITNRVFCVRCSCSDL